MNGHSLSRAFAASGSPEEKLIAHRERRHIGAHAVGKRAVSSRTPPRPIRARTRLIAAIGRHISRSASLSLPLQISRLLSWRHQTVRQSVKAHPPAVFLPPGPYQHLTGRYRRVLTRRASAGPGVFFAVRFVPRKVSVKTRGSKRSHVAGRTARDLRNSVCRSPPAGRVESRKSAVRARASTVFRCFLFLVPGHVALHCENGQIP